MEIISCFEPEQAYSFCGALTIEEMLNSQRLPNRFGVSVSAAVRAVAEVTAVDGRAVMLNVTAYDEREQIGSGTHARFAVAIDKFMAKAEGKR